MSCLTFTELSGRLLVGSTSGAGCVAAALRKVCARLNRKSQWPAIKGNNPEGMTGSSQTLNKFRVERRGRQARRRGCAVSLIVIQRRND